MSHSKPPRSPALLIQVEKMRRDFVANVSHELRTPLTVINGYVETFLARREEYPAEWYHTFQQMHQHCQRMEHLIEDLLLLSQLETPDIAGHYPWQPVNVPSMLAQLCNEIRDLSGERAHRIILECDNRLGLLGAEKELKSLFSNLMVNAVKYTPRQGEIIIRWQREGTGAIFSVVDTGIGIEAEHIPRLTERFYRVDRARSRESGGTGLGLAIVKHVLLRYGVQLEVESEVSKGSCFTCRFREKDLVGLVDSN